MNATKIIHRKAAGAWALVLALGLVVGCGGDGSLIGDPVPNARPETTVTGTPPVLNETGFEVSFFWTGSDPDGEVVGFEWRISNNGEDGIVDPADTLESVLPWSFTTSTDSTFQVTADLDSFQIDVDVIPSDPDDPYGDRFYRYWQTHTFFIRSVDELGARDKTPANVSFTATTIAPRVVIDLPVNIPSITCRESAKVLTFGWTGTDPDYVTEEPTEIRYMLLPADNGGNCYTKEEFETRNPPLITNDNPLWSEWIPYDAPQDEGRIVTLPRQESQRKFLFVVQARDIAGAVTPIFEWGFNVRHVNTSDGKFPLLDVREQFLGGRGWIGDNGVTSFDVVSGQPLTFTWTANAAEYAGIVEAFRYGWDLVDPDDPNDPGWSVPWGNGPNWRRAPVRSFSQGSHNFVVQCRDNSGTISRGVYNLQVIQITERNLQRPLLLVDDWRNGATQDEQALDALWDSEWEDILSGRVQGFQAGDILDAETQLDRVSFATLNDYQSVIWFTSANGGSFFHSRLAPIGPNLPVYNWLEVYQARVGNLLFVGPGSMVNAVEDFGGGWVFPHVYNVPANPPLGFGIRREADGSTTNRGTLRWPYTAWCLEITDVVRPAIGFLFPEQDNPGLIARTRNCDSLLRAVLDPDFLDRFPDARPPANVRTLEPNDRRKNEAPGYQFTAEEVYNSLTTPRQLSLLPRSCQVPMFRFEARRDDGVFENGFPSEQYVAHPDSLCKPVGAQTSRLHNGVVGVVSTVYSDTKQLRNSEDFLWGFHPLAFERADVEKSLLWILQRRWDLPVQ